MIVLNLSAAMSYARSVRRWFFYGAGFYVTGSVFCNHVGSVAACDGRSMEPAILDGNWVAVHRYVELTMDAERWSSQISRQCLFPLERPQVAYKFPLSLRPIRFTNKVDRNDVVLLRSPQDPHEFLVKRVVKLEGETIDRKSKTSKPWIPR